MTVATIDPQRLLQAVRAMFPEADDQPPRFLARGEYSLNYLVDGASGPAVVRLVTGSQIGLALPEQVRYEARALDLLAPSGRTPRLLAVQPEAVDVPYPFLVETFLPGRPLDYATDLASAAVCLAAIHAVPVLAGHGLQVHRDPGPSIVDESREWAAAYLGWDAAPDASRRMLAQAIALVEADLDRAAEVFAEPDLVLVNYDVNTHNFIVGDDGFVALVDWEKARVAPAVQDLAHFLLPTTTLWRAATATRLSAGQEQAFIDAYLAARPHPDREMFMAQLAQMRRLIALRAVSWCSWAVQAAASGEREMGNTETLDRSRMYLEPSFLAALFGIK